MGAVTEAVVEDGLRRCPISLSDLEDCPNQEMVEVDRDGDLEYWECPECGCMFGYRQIVSTEPDCQLGIPESVRRGATDQAPRPVSLGLSIPIGPPRG